LIRLPERGAGEPEGGAETARHPGCGFLGRPGQSGLALGQGRDHVVQFLSEDRLAGAGPGLGEHAHEVAGIVTAQVASGALPSADRFRSPGVQPGRGPENAQQPVRSGKDIA